MTTKAAPRVLVVDDEEDIREFLRLVLEAGGYEVECVADGRQGLDAIESHPPDLVILDLMMPVMDGWEVLARVADRHPPVVLVVSAFGDAERARREGAAASVNKPFRPHELLARCREVLGEPAAIG